MMMMMSKMSNWVATVSMPQTQLTETLQLPHLSAAESHPLPTHIQCKKNVTPLGCLPLDCMWATKIFKKLPLWDACCKCPAHSPTHIQCQEEIIDQTTDGTQERDIK